MPTKELVTKVWIAPGCIVCDACETAAPTVFEVQHENNTCIIRPAALNAEFTRPLTDEIIQAAEECPVDVIKFETVPVEVSEADAAAMAKTAGADAAKAPAAGKGEPSKKHVPAKPKEQDPAIQALLAATTVRGGNVVIRKGMKDFPETAQQLAKLSPDQLPPDAKFQKVLEKSKPEPQEEKEEGATRRQWLLGTSWVVLLAGGGLANLLAFQRFMMPNVLEEEDPKVRCGPLSKYAAMAVGDVNEDYKPVKPFGFWIVREPGRVSALSIICTHLGCIPSWLPNDRKFKCPCHGSGYTYTGVNFEGPTPRPLERFRIYVEGDEVVVDRSRRFLAMGPTDLAVWSDADASIPV